MRRSEASLLEKRKGKTKDSLFSIVGSFRIKEGNWSERDDWRE
ncbi:MAG: hypothetical protein WC568_07550 [Candidatus Methanoperedens sp.]